MLVVLATKASFFKMVAMLLKAPSLAEGVWGWVFLLLRVFALS
ncbi:hypothetical protein [Helicobacter sp. T3_23-1059]